MAKVESAAPNLVKEAKINNDRVTSIRRRPPRRDECSGVRICQWDLTHGGTIRAPKLVTCETMRIRDDLVLIHRIINGIIALQGKPIFNFPKIPELGLQCPKSKLVFK